MAHVNDMLAVVCHIPLEESSILPIARVRAVASGLDDLDWLQSLTYLPSSGMYPLTSGKWGGGRKVRNFPAGDLV
jgi:hypothetical protein